MLGFLHLRTTMYLQPTQRQSMDSHLYVMTAMSIQVARPEETKMSSLALPAQRWCRWIPQKGENGRVNGPSPNPLQKRKESQKRVIGSLRSSQKRMIESLSKNVDRAMEVARKTRAGQQEWEDTVATQNQGTRCLLDNWKHIPRVEYRPFASKG